MSQVIRSTLKGKALLIALDTGLVKREAFGKYNIAPFLRFWERFSRLIPDSDDEIHDFIQMLGSEGDKASED